MKRSTDWSPPTSSERAQKPGFFKALLNALRPPPLEKARSHRAFAACETVKPSRGFSLKCIHVEGAGELQLPLAIEDTSKLQGVCEQAPFGKGLSTVVDTKVRRCWQVDASKVTFPGAPTFLSDTIQTLAMKAVCALGLNGAEAQVEAHFYKLLFYEAGGHFTFHRDSEKETGMFGSLILQLPTEEGYTGGKFVVKHNKKIEEFDCRMVSAIGFCYTVFFADCLHELQTIQSGTKLCLAFNLVKRSPSEPIHKGSMSDRLERVQLVLEPWLKEATQKRPHVPGGKLAIPLQHQYTEQNLSFAGLKGDDIILTELLKECRDRNKNQSLDLHLCIVTIRNAESDDDGSCFLEDERADFNFGNWIGLDDQPVAFKDLRLDMEKEVVGAKEELFDSEPDEEDHHYTGNEGATVESLYHTAMLVGWPKAHSVSIACGTSVSRALDILQNTFKTSDPQFCEQLHQIVLYCQTKASEAWRDERNSTEDSVTPQLLSLCTRVSMSEDLLQILQLLGKALYQYGGKNQDKGDKVGVRNAKVAEAIGSAVQVFGWELLSSAITNLAKECASTQGESFAHLARQLTCMGNTEAGALVANTASKSLEGRIAELESHKMPEFSWCQPLAKLGEYPDVEKFLRETQERYEHKGFRGLSDARSFCERYLNNYGWNASAGYSATGTPHGRGCDAFCVIQKTRRLFDFSLDHWQKEQKVIERLRLELGKLRSAVPENNSIALPAFPVGSGQPDSKRQRLGTDVTEDTMEKAKGSKIQFIDLTFSE